MPGQPVCSVNRQGSCHAGLGAYRVMLRVSSEHRRHEVVKGCFLGVLLEGFCGRMLFRDVVFPNRELCFSLIVETVKLCWSSIGKRRPVLKDITVHLKR